MDINRERRSRECEAPPRAGVIGFLQDCYKAYRESKKKRGRERRDSERLRRRIDFYQRFIQSGDLCFDVGANLGNRTEVFLKLGARVVAVEPQAFCVEMLREKFGSNPQFTLIPQGLARNEGQATIHVGNAHTLCSMSTDWIEKVRKAPSFSGCYWDREEVVSTTTLDALIDQFGVPDFCKIDVEGFEYEVIRGLSRPIGALSLEYTLGVLEPAIQSIRHLASLGMDQFNYSQGESMKLEMPESVNADTIVGILTSPDRQVLFGDVYARKAQS